MPDIVIFKGRGEGELLNMATPRKFTVSRIFAAHNHKRCKTNLCVVASTSVLSGFLTSKATPDFVAVAFVLFFLYEGPDREKTVIRKRAPLCMTNHNAQETAEHVLELEAPLDGSVIPPVQ